MKNKILLINVLISLSIVSPAIGQTLNFDEPFGTQSWTEDGHSWSWDNNGWDNIRTYSPHTGTGHGMSAPGYHSKLSCNGNLNIQGIWLNTSFASDFSHLHIKGYNVCGSLIYDVSLNPMDYEFNYTYVTLNWTNVKSILFDYNSVSPMNPVDVFYDDMDYTYIEVNSVLNFDELFGSQSWIEDDHSWSWDNTGWDNIRTYNPHSGTGHGMSAPGYHSKLSSNGLLDIQGIWLNTSFASDFSHLHLKGFNNFDSLIYDVSLNPMDYEFNYVYVTLNWFHVKSFMVDYNSISPMNPVDLFYDDMDYTYTAAGTDTRTECSPFTWVDGNTYTASNNTASYNIIGGASTGCDSLVSLNLAIKYSTSATQTISACKTYTWIDGNTYTTNNNTATYTLTNALGCDSVIALDLTINSVDVATSNSGETIVSNAILASYQWLDCNNSYAPITGDTNQTFVAVANGNYAVEITQNGCTDTSTCVNIASVGIVENGANDFSLYPNPAKCQINVKVNDKLIGSDFNIFDNVGKLILSGKLYSENTIVELGHLSGGIYLLNVRDNLKKTFKVITD
jgi:hypothetical protein